MNRAIRIALLIGVVFFFATHYLVMSINKEYFPIFAYLYPFVAKVWFETGRFLLALDIQTDLTIVFNAIKYLLLLGIAIAIFAFKYALFYKITLWLCTIIFTAYLLALVFLGLIMIYPIYTICIAFALAIFLSLLKKQP